MAIYFFTLHKILLQTPLPQINPDEYWYESMSASSASLHFSSQFHDCA